MSRDLKLIGAVVALEATVIAKPVASAMPQVLGWASKRFWRGKRSAEILKSAVSMRPLEVIPQEIAESLDDESRERLLEFVETAEFRHQALLHVTAKLTGKCGRATLSNSQLQAQMRELVRLYVDLEGQILASVAHALHESLEREVLAALEAFLQDPESIPESTRKALLKSASSIAAAAVRNNELLRDSLNLAQIQSFVKEFNRQIESLHGSIRLPHANTSRSVPVERLFVPAEISISIGDEDQEAESLGAVLAGDLRVVLLGDPGAGKSTNSLKFVYDCARGTQVRIGVRTAFFVSLKDYAEQYAARRTSMADYLEALCLTPYAVKPPAGAIEFLLLNGAAIVVFDGLDELLDTSQRRDVVKVVEGFASRYPTTQVLVTSRRVGYEEAPLDSNGFTVASLGVFDEEKVENYAHKWFTLDESIEPARRTSLANAFIEDSEYVSDLRANPLMLSLMCGIYSTERYIPKNRPDVYEKCSLLLFERWDKQRGINAPLPFDAHVMSSIRSLALWLYTEQSHRTGISRDELIIFMRTYLRERRFDDEDEAENAAASFIDFCRGRAWVLTDVGAELYWFTHQTFLEYFAALQIVREHPMPEDLFKVLWPHIRASEWDVVTQLAVQTLGKNVDDGADRFLALTLDACDAQRASGADTNGIQFAARALEFIVPRPEIIRRVVVASLQATVSADDMLKSPLPLLARAATENAALLNKYLDEELRRFSEACEGPVTNVTRKYLDRLSVIGLCWASFARNASATSQLEFQDRVNLHETVRRSSAPLVAVAERTVPWVAAKRSFEGRGSLRSLIETFGVSSLYEWRMGGQVFDPPPAWVLMHEQSNLSRSGRRRRSGGPEAVPASFEYELLPLLLTVEGPWLARDWDPGPLVPVRGLAIELRTGKDSTRMQKVVDGLAIMASLPLLELVHWMRHSRSPSRRSRESAIRTVVRRGRPLKGHLSGPDLQEQQMPLDMLFRDSLSPEVASYVESWMRGERDLTA